jgi:hypothetical protein
MQMMLHCVPVPLQDLINSFVDYCDRHGLTVDPKKCEVVVFVVFAKSCKAWPGFGDWNFCRDSKLQCTSKL